MSNNLMRVSSQLLKGSRRRGRVICDTQANIYSGIISQLLENV
jgi:hypothetical protein